MYSTDEKEASICPIARVAELLGDECTLLIVRDLLTGTKRFKDIEASLSPISSRTITNKLKMLEEKGILTRTEFKEKPPRVEYELSSHGRKLSTLIEDMKVYGKKYM